MEELIELFDLNRVPKGGAVFNIKRLDWFNAQHLKSLNTDQLFDKIGEYMDNFYPDSKIIKDNPSGYIKKIIELEAPRLTKLSEFIDFSDFFFKENLVYSKELLKWKSMEDKEIITSLSDCLNILKDINEKDFNRINIQIKFYNFITENDNYQKDKGKLLWPMRVALSGKKASPSPFEIAEILGKKKTILRIEQALNQIKT